MGDISKIIGSNIRKYRMLKRMTREQLAEAIELDTAYLGQCERGERQLGLNKTIQVIEFFGVTPNDIISIHGQKTQPHREQYLQELSLLLSDCSENQILAILRIAQNATPFLRG